MKKSTLTEERKIEARILLDKGFSRAGVARKMGVKYHVIFALDRRSKKPVATDPPNLRKTTPAPLDPSRDRLPADIRLAADMIALINSRGLQRKEVHRVVAWVALNYGVLNL